MRQSRKGGLSILAFAAAIAVLTGAGGSLLGSCGPFTDFTDAGFCPFVLEIFTLGITTGTTPTTYDPGSSVSRLQMAAFLSRSVDGVLKRGGRRASLRQFWSPQSTAALQKISVGQGPLCVKSDGSNVWVTSTSFTGTVTQIRGSDGKLLETWTGAEQALGVIAAMGRVFVAGATVPGKLYRIDPTQPPGAVTTVASNLGGGAFGIAYDGARVWTANRTGSVSIVTPGPSIPWTATTVSTGFLAPRDAIFDGANMWVVDDRTPDIMNPGIGRIFKLDAGGAILQTVTLGTFPSASAFDGANLWVPNGSGEVFVIRASNGTVLQTLTGNGLSSPSSAAFDGQRILVTSFNNTVSLWKAADLTPLGSLFTGDNTNPARSCSDGVNFWFTLFNSSQLARF